MRPDPIDIRHQALSRYVDVVAPIYRGLGASAQAKINGVLAHMPMPLSYHAEVVGGTPDNPTSHGLFLTFVLAAAIGCLPPAASGVLELAACRSAPRNRSRWCSPAV